MKQNVIKDPLLLNYWSITNNNSGATKSLVHRSHEANFYYCTNDDKPDDTEKFLLMPAEKTDEYSWYFVFILDEKAKACWTMNNNNDNEKLRDEDFTGSDNQKFAFVKNKDNSYYILCKQSGKYLNKGGLYCGHHAIRQHELNDDDNDYRFYMHCQDKVNIPTFSNDEKKQYNPGNIPLPPAPSFYGDKPDFPKEIIVGASLLPFFNVQDDPTLSGSYVKAQIKKQPYYKFLRRQQFRYQDSACINHARGTRETQTISYTEGVTDTYSNSMTKSTKFSIGIDMGTEASLGVDGASVSASRGFRAGWEASLGVTITNTHETFRSETVSNTIEFVDNGMDITYITWQIYDIWEIVYDSNNSDSWTVPTEYAYPNHFPLNIEANVMETKPQKAEA